MTYRIEMADGSGCTGTLEECWAWLVRARAAELLAPAAREARERAEAEEYRASRGKSWGPMRERLICPEGDVLDARGCLHLVDLVALAMAARTAKSAWASERRTQGGDN